MVEAFLYAPEVGQLLLLQMYSLPDVYMEPSALAEYPDQRSNMV